MPMIICRQCGNQSFRFLATALYCSDSCKTTAYVDRMRRRASGEVIDLVTGRVTCPVCNKSVERTHYMRRYCSSLCRNRANAYLRTRAGRGLPPRQRRYSVKCERCGKRAVRGTATARFCSRLCAESTRRLRKKELAAKLEREARQRVRCNRCAGVIFWVNDEGSCINCGATYWM